ncbi:hypothetical protein Tco_1090049 [Tanacetum coccineum]|uniref:Uncharacterized protein n=1 Tax=Tanacetum coccineum TaxID=301880 RepID=A0ABQ5I327_9ASTR
MKSVSLKQRLAGKKSLKKNWMQKDLVSKQGRKSAKDEPSVHKDPLFDELDDDEIDKLETEMPRNGEGQVSTNKEEVSTDRPDEGTDDQTKEIYDPQTPPTTTTPTIFEDDETNAQKIKGKKKIEEEDESDTESEGIPEAKKKFKKLAHDE